ncbi:MAG: GldG family protein [Gammaproteobacteria bacterium]|nr:GldG family protein [Gammaproteobacteria bacterium]
MALKKSLLSSSGLLLALALLFVVNIFAVVLFSSARIDLTANQLYTLTDGSRNILRALEKPVTLRLYYSKVLNELPGLSSYAQRVDQLLREYSAVAGDKIQLEVIHPEPFSDEEDEAVASGLKGAPLQDGEVAYFGLVASAEGRAREVIPFFQPDNAEFLEYELTNLVYRLTGPEKIVIGLWSSLPLKGGGRANPFTNQPPPAPWGIYDQMQQLFTVQDIDYKATEIPEEVDVLMLVHPKYLDDASLYAIDQFVLRGGHLLAFLDPFATSEVIPSDPFSPNEPPLPKESSSLGPLLEKWGVELVEGKVVADRGAAQRVSTGAGGTADYLIWLRLLPDHLATDDILTSRLAQINAATVGSIRLLDGAEATLTPLIWSSDSVQLLETDLLQSNPTPEQLLTSYQPDSGRQILAARLTGPATTAFPDGKPIRKDPEAEQSEADTQMPEEETPLVLRIDTEDDPNFVAEAASPINVTLVADADLLHNQFWVQIQNFYGERIAFPYADNGKFVLNALEHLSGSSDLISVRSRGTFARPFTVVNQLAMDAESRFLETEQTLQEQLRQTEAKLLELEQQKTAEEESLLSPEQAAEIERFRNEKVRVRKQLRDVQRDLRGDIDRLEARLKFINIALIPLLIILGALGLGLLRWWRNRVA